MKAFVIAGKGNCYFEEKPMPVLRDEHSVLVKTQAAGICGTDVHIYEGTHLQSAGKQRIPGHEFVGTVTEVGSAVKKFKPGDRVVHEPISYCGKCYACRHGSGNVCRDVQVTGCNMDGGFEEYFAADEAQWHLIPDWATWEQAALIEPYTIAAQTCSRARLLADDTVLIFGAGPIGLACADTAKHFGAKVIISEIIDKRLELARALGADLVVNPKETDVSEAVMGFTGGEGPNVVLECAGIPAFVPLALDLLSPAGRLVEVAPSAFKLESGRPIMVKQLEIIGSRLQMNQFAPVIARYALYKENIGRMITDVFSFEDCGKAFERAASRDPNVGKVIVRFE